MPKIKYIDEPNMILPLAASYNTRGNAGYTQAITNADDQRKVNSTYEPIRNALTGKTTLYLTKRPGVSSSIANYGLSTSAQTPYLWEQKPANIISTVEAEGDRWLFVFNSDTSSVGLALGSISTQTDILTNNNYEPSYVDKTLISQTDIVVLQCRAINTITQSTFYTSSASGGSWVALTTSTLDQCHGKMEFVDGYGFIAKGQKIFNSALNNLDVWSPTNYISRTGLQDVGIGLGRLGSQIISWGTATMEVFRNAGNAVGSPLEAMPSLAQRYGLPRQTGASQRHYYAVLDNHLYWKGTNPSGAFVYNGTTVEKISTPAIDKILTERIVRHVGGIEFHGKRAIAFSLEQVGTATQRALLFCPDWKDWFEWTSSVFQPVTSARNMSIFVGATATHSKLCQIAVSTNMFIDDATDYTMTHQFKLPTNGNAHQQLRMFGIKGDTALSTTTSVLNVRFSTDDWQTSTAARTIDLTSAKKHIYRCGSFTDLGVYLDHTGNLDCRLESVVARIE